MKGLLALRGKKQLELAEYFDMSKQTLSNKMARGSWSADDLTRVAEFCSCKLAFILPDGQQILIGPENQEKVLSE